MRLAIIFLLLAALRLSAAVGDLIGLEVETNGWVLRATIAGLNTNGNFFAGLGTNNSITSTTKLSLLVLSPGFDSSGASQQVARVIYGTTILRLAGYQLGTTNDIQAQGDDCVARIALSEYIYSNDVATATALAGYFAVTNGSGTNANAFSNQSVTNGSVQNHQAVIANVSRPRWMMITNRSDEQYDVAIAAFHRHGVACVKFYGHDNLGNLSFTNTVTEPTVSPEWRMLGENAVEEFIGRLYYTNLFGLWVTNVYEVYPRIGLAPLKSSEWPSGVPTPMWQSDWRFNNRSNLNFAHAVVATNGNDSTGFATNRPWNGLDTANPPLPFATIDGAIKSCLDTNGLNGRPYLAGSYIYLMSSNAWVWSGGTGRRGTNGGGYVTITKYPGLPRSDVVIQPISGLTPPTNNICFDGVTIIGTNNNWIARATNLWFKDCWVEFNGPGTAHIQDSPLWYFTHCTMTNWNSQGLGPFSGNQSFPALVRGCDLSGLNQDCLMMTWLGNRRFRRDHAVSFTMSQCKANAVTWTNQNSIVAYNTLFGLIGGGGAIISWAGLTNTLRGAAVVGNIFEFCTNNANSGYRMGTTDGFHETNRLVWNNVFLGAGLNCAYNESGSSPYYRYLWSIKNNVFDDLNTAQDSALTPNAGRTGAWPILHGVGMSGNAMLEVGGVGVHPGLFLPEFIGLNTLPDLRVTTIGSHRTVAVKTNTFAKWVLTQAFQGTGQPNTTNGSGDYRLQSSSPLFWNIRTDRVKAYDSGGRTTSAIDPPGAYTAGNAKKGAFF